ncbi:LuxR C-terminal-related transcriptional regulator [Kitasatospora sp. NPDC127111]|uniref:LuxR C-terminal-related transcriptional regulator n=1 Tax=Kitasatospora sp. NPDC127111 TaxID=3345363 RepID=UPI00363E8447
MEALRSSLLHERDGNHYAFRHALAGRAAYQQVPLPRRLRLHRRAVAALERQSPTPLALIARHALALGERDEWLHRTEEAAERAAAAGDREAATTLLRGILDQPALEPDRRERAALALARCTGDGLGGAADTAQLRSVLELPGLSPASRGSIRLALGLVLLNQAADRAGFAELVQAVDELADRPEQAARAALALALDEAEPPARAREWLARAESAVADGSEDSLRAALRTTRLTLLCHDGDPSGWPLLDLLPRDPQDIEALGQSARALHRTGEGAAALGHDRRAAALLAESVRLAEQAGLPALALRGRLSLLRLDLLAGRWDGLEERFDAPAVDRPELASSEVERSLALGLLSAARGRTGRALHHFTLAAARAQASPDLAPILRAAAGLASVRLARGAARDAMTAAGPAVALLRRGTAWPRASGLLPSAVEAALACGDRAFAERLAEEAEQELRDRDAPAATAELRLAQGHVLLDAEPGPAAEHFTAAHAAWQAIGRPYDAARALERAGLALARSGDPAATAALADSTDAYARLGATGDLARSRRLAHELGLSRAPSPGRRGYGDRLSPRERQVAELLASSASNQEIATALRLSPRTVENHVASVLRKLRTTRKSVADAIDSPTLPDRS